MSNSKVTKCSRRSIEIKSVSDNGASVKIKGWANKAVVDRGMDLIKMDAWSLDNFKKNPMMLFNHDMSKPVGKWDVIEPREEGLYVEGTLSKSKDPMVSYVRDMVSEGIINSLSVGFNCNDAESIDSVNHIKSAELFEVSLVAIPMNQDSQFELSQKAFKKMSYKDARAQVLETKGAKSVARILDAMEQNGSEKEAIIQAVAEKAESTPEEVGQCLSGDCQMSDKILSAFAEILGIDMAELKEDKPDEEKPIEAQEKDLGEQALIAIKIPKDKVANAEDAAKWASENGFSGDNIKEEGDFFVVYQADPENFVDIEEQPQENGAIALVGVPKDEEQNQEDLGSDEGESEEDMAAEEKTKQAGEGAAAPAVQPKADDNPMLEVLRQMNTSLAMLVGKFDGLSEQLSKLVPAQEPMKQEPIEQTQVSEEEPASEELVKALLKRVEGIDNLVKNLGY